MIRFLGSLTENLAGLYSPAEIRVLAKILVHELCDMDENAVYLGKDTTIPPQHRSLLENAVERLRAGEPVQYITGVCDFYGATFRVRKPVLIPRPETEELVDWVLREAPSASCRILDIGTGSGCIAVSLARNLPQASVEAWDILPEALSLARENASLHGVDVQVKCQDLFQTATSAGSLDSFQTASQAGSLDSSFCGDGSFDIIVSNPPYICREEAAGMEPAVLEHESHLALFVPDDDPLKYYRALAMAGRRLLSRHGRIFMEINSRFGQETTALFRSFGYSDVVLRKDLNGRDRMVGATNNRS